MTRIQSLKFEFGYENQNNKSFYSLRETVYIIKEMTRHYCNRLICSIVGHNIEWVSNEPSLESGMSENDFDCFCTRCSH